MKTLFKSILIGLLIGNTAFAGLPPTTTAGQSGGKQTTFNIQVPFNQATGLGGPNALIETGNANILADPGFESGGTTKWTASGGATATVNATAKGTGSYGYDWDSNAAGQTLTGTAITIPPGLKGKNAVVSCNVYTVSGTATHTLAAFDGTNSINPTAIASVAGQWIRTSVNFLAPSSGTITMQMKSVASNEPEIYVDDCILEDAAFFNLSQVSQSYVVGQLTFPATSGCTWAITQTSYASDFSAQASCPTATITGGMLSSPSKTPQVQLANAQPGTYDVTFLFRLDPSATTTQVCRIIDDLNNVLMETSTVGTSSTAYGFVSEGTQTYTTTGSRTWKLQCYSSSGSVTVKADTGSFQAIVKYSPSQSQTGYRPDQTPGTWSGTSTLSGSTASTSMTDFGSVSGSVTPTTSVNITCSAASSLVGITCSLPRAGAYKICYGGWTSNSGANSNYSQLTDGSGNALTGTQVFTSAGAGYGGSVGMCGGYTAASAGSATFKIQGKVISGTQTINIVSWNVDEGTASTGAPYLTGSVTSNTSGQERVESAEISTFNGSVCGNLTFNGGYTGWISCSSVTGTGDITYAISPAYSNTPNCSCTVKDTGAQTCQVVSETASSVRIREYSVGSTPALVNGSSAGNGYILHCKGPR